MKGPATFINAFLKATLYSEKLNYFREKKKEIIYVDALRSLCYKFHSSERNEEDD